MATWRFNPAQLVTWQQARDLAAQIEALRPGLPMGGGVKPETTDPATSGIYVPSWSGGPAGFPEPSDSATQSFWLHFRFNNGAEGVNIGLILDWLSRYPNAQQYVFGCLSSELALMGRF